MALETAAQTVEQAKPGPKCGFGKILNALGPDDRTYYEQMRDAGKPGTFISDVFRADGHDISEFTVRRHMGGKCSCR